MTALRLGVLTVSDGVIAGTRQDGSGDMIVAWAESRQYEIRDRLAVADERESIASVLAGWSDSGQYDVILTTGGTGLAERDVTPEATTQVIEREAPGIAEVIRAAGYSNTVYSVLSRGVAGVRGSTLIVNLPGGPSGVRDGLLVLSEVVDHAAALLRGATSGHSPGSPA
ncbi:MAG: MogA/MoaB family molybdenum cofactor biosynthesis protein [Gemmatimonadota bacterium]